MRPSQSYRLSVGATQAASEAACNYCTPACRNGQGTPHFCGDGSTDAPNEACDDANSNTETLAVMTVQHHNVAMAF